MSIKITIDGTTVANCVTGYRLAIGLQSGGASFSFFQLLCEERNAYGPAAGAGRTSPNALLDGGGALPAVAAPVTVQCQRPSAPGAALTHDMQLLSCQLFAADRRVRGEIVATMLTFIVPVTGISRPTSPGIVALANSSAGEVDILGTGSFVPILDIDSSSNVLSIRYLRSNAVDVAGWQGANAGNAFQMNLQYRFCNADQEVQSLPVALGGGANVQNAIIFDEVCGRFADAARISAFHWKSAFGGAGLTQDSLMLNLEDVLPLPIGQQVPPPYNPGGNVEERLSIVFQNDIDFPNW